MTNTNINTMKKDALIALVLANSDEYKKTHLVEMKKDEVLSIAAALPISTEDTDQVEEQPEVTANDADEGAVEQGAPTEDEVPVAEESAEEEPADAEDSEGGAEEEAPAENLPEYTDLSMVEQVEKAYSENAKLVKGSRIDKDEFQATTIEITLAYLDGTETMAEVRAAVKDTISKLMQNKSAFIPMNDTEKKMLATLPLMKDFTLDSKIVGKDWLDMVEATHNIAVSSTRALMVTLKKKKYIAVKGRNSGEKITTVQLKERGIRYLTNAGLLNNEDLGREDIPA